MIVTVCIKINLVGQSSTTRIVKFAEQILGHPISSFRYFIRRNTLLFIYTYGYWSFLV